MDTGTYCQRVQNYASRTPKKTWKVKYKNMEDNKYKYSQTCVSGHLY